MAFKAASLLVTTDPSPSGAPTSVYSHFKASANLKKKENEINTVQEIRTYT